MALPQELKWSAQNGDIDKVKQACSEPGFDINAVAGAGGRQLIHCAADYGQVEVLLYLISKGANVNAVDDHGLSPLLNAVFEGHTDAVKLLIENGADKTIKAPGGESLLEAAEKEDIKKLLR